MGYRVETEKETIAYFQTYIEALAYCECFDFVRLEPNGNFSPLRIIDKGGAVCR